MLDWVYGGGHAFAWLADYLDREVAPLLAGWYGGPCRPGAVLRSRRKRWPQCGIPAGSVRI
jgi:hypothetical protein